MFELKEPGQALVSIAEVDLPVGPQSLATWSTLSPLGGDYIALYEHDIDFDPDLGYLDEEGMVIQRIIIEDDYVSPCEPGEWLDIGSCTEADPGNYVPLGGAPGRFHALLVLISLTQGQESCLQADPGHYVENNSWVELVPNGLGTTIAAGEGATRVQYWTTARLLVGAGTNTGSLEMVQQLIETRRPRQVVWGLEGLRLRLELVRPIPARSSITDRWLAGGATQRANSAMVALDGMTPHTQQLA